MHGFSANNTLLVCVLIKFLRAESMLIILAAANLLDINGIYSFFFFNELYEFIYLDYTSYTERASFP